MTHKRLKPDARKDEIMTAALYLAAQSHYLTITREEIAKVVGVSGPAIQYHFKTMQQLRTEVMRAAVKREDLRVVAQGLLSNNAHAIRASQELRNRARSSLG